MSIAEDSEELITKLKSSIRTSLYSKFFLLRLEVVINGQSAQVEADKKGWLTLYCRNPKVGVTFESLVADVNQVLQQHDLHGVSNYWCEDVPRFELKVSSHDDLTDLFHLKKRIEEEIQEGIASKLMLQLCTNGHGKKLTAVDVSVQQSIYLLTSSFDCHPFQVTEENITECLHLFNTSKVAEFRNLFYGQIPDSGPITLRQLEKELHKVTDWFGLGIQLGVEGHTLKRIQKDNSGDLIQCRREMFSEWLKADNNKWSDIVEALQILDQPGLANKIAKEHGVLEKNTTFPCDKKLRRCTTEDLDKSEKALERTKQKYKKLKEDVYYYQKQIEILKKEKEHLQQKLESQKQKKEDLKKKLQELEFQHSMLEEELKLTKFKLENKNKEVAMQEEMKQKMEVYLHERRKTTRQWPTPHPSRASHKQPATACLFSREPLDRQPQTVLPKEIVSIPTNALRLQYSASVQENICRETAAPPINRPKTASSLRTKSPGRPFSPATVVLPNEKSKPKSQTNENVPEAFYTNKETGASQKRLLNRPKTASSFLKMPQNLTQPQTLSPIKQTLSPIKQAISVTIPEAGTAKPKRQFQKRPITAPSFPIKPRDRKSETMLLNEEQKFKWRRVKSAPDMIHSGTAAVGDNTIFVIGQNSCKVHMYYLSTDEWKEIPKPCPHINPGLVFIDGVLTAVGGKKASHLSTNEVVSYKSEWETKLPPMQHAHSNPIVLRYKDWVIAMDRNDIKETEVWNIHNHYWSKINLQIELDLKSFTATVCGDNLIVVNMLGMSDCAIECESLLNSIVMTTPSGPSQVCQVDDQSLEWRGIKSLSKEATVTTFNGYAMCVNEDGIYKLKLDEGEWVKIEDMSTLYVPVKAPMVCTVKNQMVVIGGAQGEMCTSTVQIGSY